MGIHDRDWNRQQPKNEFFWLAWPLWAKILSVVALLILLVAIVRNANPNGDYGYGFDNYEEYYQQMEERLPFYLALQSGDAKAIKRLLKEDPKLMEDAAYGFGDEMTDGKQGALAMAIMLGNQDSVAAVLESGANPNRRDADGRTPLHEAAFLGNATLAKLLIQHGADVNARDAVGFTPLFDAAQNGAVGTAKTLIDNGANPRAQTPDGQTPASIADQFNQPRITALLKQQASHSAE